MADIELVIKIPEEIRQVIIANIPLSSEQKSTLDKYVNHAIASGKPLPKGHSDLIDRKELLKQSYRIDDSATLSTRDVVNKEEIDSAQAIIEAETEAEDGK